MAVRSRKIYKFKYVELRPRRCERDTAKTFLIDDSHLSGGDIAEEFRPDGVERACLRREHESPIESSDAQRPYAALVANRDE